MTILKSVKPLEDELFECESCEFKMVCLTVQTPPCQVKDLDIHDLYKFYSPDTVNNLIRAMFKPYET